MGNVDYNSIRSKIRQINRIKKEIDSVVASKFEGAKEKMINDFESHPITQEIKSGPDGSNQSNTLGGVGNLFSYIGFTDGSQPTDEVKSILENEVKISKGELVLQNNKLKIKYKINYPSENEISQKTPLPWENGKSWVTGMERGISGFGNYIYKVFLKGRSKMGIQSKNSIRGSSFRTRMYWTEIVKNFLDNVNSIKLKWKRN